MFARVSALAAAVAVALSMMPAGMALAASPAVSVAVPAPSGGGSLPGCYTANHQIYGPYTLGVCLSRNGGGNYTVTGGGLNCRGGLDWYDMSNGRVSIDLMRSSCGRGTDWTGDSLSCSIGGWQPPPLFSGNIAGIGVSVPSPSIPVPGFKQLNCTYNPVARGYSPVNVSLRRS